MSETEKRPSPLASEMAAMVAELMRKSGSAMSALCPELQMLTATPVQQGALTAALAMRRVLCLTAEGRQALRDLGFEPILDDVQGE